MSTIRYRTDTVETGTFTESSWAAFNIFFNKTNRSGKNKTRGNGYYFPPPPNRFRLFRNESAESGPG